MNWPLLSRLLGLLGLLVGGSMALSLPFAFPACGPAEEFERAGFLALCGAIAVAVFSGGTLWWVGRDNRNDSVLRKEALAVVGLGWIFAGVLGALPLLFSGSLRAADTPVTVADALFESVSGFTTTGASVLTELEDPAFVPRCVLFWRSFTHWLGGMGIIVLFVAILGQLGAGGKAMMRRETPGPISDAVRPRVQDHAAIMWRIYVSLSLLLAGLFYLEGMTVYDALCHSFGTMATGGFSTHNASIGYFDSPLIECTIIAFMVLAGTNFSLYYLALRGTPALGEGKVIGRLKLVFGDPEFRVYLAILLLATLALTVNLLVGRRYADWAEALRHSAFMAATIMTTTGFGTEDYTRWGEFAKGMILMLMFVGGCAGSTAGGIKVVRFMLFVKVIRLEIEQAFRPNVVRPLKIFGLPVEKDLRHDVVVYFSLILMIFALSFLALNVIEPLDQWHATEGGAPNRETEKLIDTASAVASTLNNIGPGLGVLGPTQNYSSFSPQGKLLLTLLMLLGRLELFAILVLFVPGFWRLH